LKAIVLEYAQRSTKIEASKGNGNGKEIINIYMRIKVSESV